MDILENTSLSLETSHHRKFPFLVKTYLFGRKAGVSPKGLIFFLPCANFTIPGLVSSTWLSPNPGPPCYQFTRWSEIKILWDSPITLKISSSWQFNYSIIQWDRSTVKKKKTDLAQWLSDTENMSLEPRWPQVSLSDRSTVQKQLLNFISDPLFVR